jgi:hypothetical protein
VTAGIAASSRARNAVNIAFLRPAHMDNMRSIPFYFGLQKNNFVPYFVIQNESSTLVFNLKLNSTRAGARLSGGAIDG